MRLYRLCVVLSVIFSLSVDAQTIISLDEALNLAYQNNLGLNNQKSNIKKAESGLDGSLRLPNPTFTYAREDLSNNELNISEWSATGSLPINFLWARWSNIEAKEKFIHAQNLYYQHLEFSTGTQVRKIYNSVYHHTEIYNSLKSMLSQLSLLSESAKYRLEEGDISEYEFQRVLIELSKVRSIVSEIELKKYGLENELKQLIGISLEEQITTTLILPKDDLLYKEKELLELGQQHRSDLKALSLIIESEQSNLSYNNAQIIPEINLTAGYKKQSDNFRGSVVQLDFEIPIFNRNQTKIEESEIDISILNRKAQYLNEEVKKEIIESFKKYQLEKSLFYKNKQLKFKNLYSTSAYSYGQGEISLVEFIDGINAFVDALILVKESEIKYMSSIFNLENALGLSLVKTENN